MGPLFPCHFQVQVRPEKEGCTAGKGGTGTGLIHLLLYQHSLTELHPVPGTVLGSGVTMVGTAWLCPYGPREQQGLVGKHQMPWNNIHLLKVGGESQRPSTPELEMRRNTEREPQNTYRRLDASEEPAGDEAASPGGEFVRLEAGQGLARCHQWGSPTFQFDLAQEARDLAKGNPRQTPVKQCFLLAGGGGRACPSKKAAWKLSPKRPT